MYDHNLNASVVSVKLLMLFYGCDRSLRESATTSSECTLRPVKLTLSLLNCSFNLSPLQPKCWRDAVKPVCVPCCEPHL